MNLDGVLRAARVGDIRCRPAESRSDYREAFRLIYERYLSAGLIRPNAIGVRIASQQLQPECQVIVAETAGRVVGTISLVSDERSELPLDQIFPNSVDSLRASGARITEIGCLASLDDSGRFPSPVYIALTRATIHYAQLGGYDRLVAAVHPRHAKFYERAMGFARLTGEVPCHLVNGHPAVCLAGSPHNPKAYREPWRRHFFGAPRIDLVPRGSGMSEIDHRYFSRLKDMIDQTQRCLTQQAA